MKNNKMMKASVASAMLLGLVAPTVLATTNVATAAEEKSAQARNIDESINAKTGDDSITITAANGIPLDKAKFNAYRLMDAHYISDKEEGYKIIPEWQEFFNQQVSPKNGKCSDEEARKYLEGMKEHPEQLKSFQEAIFDYAAKKNIPALGQGKASRDQYVISNLPDGYYSVIQTVDENTVSDSYNILVTVDGHNKNAKVQLKADVPALLKTINETGTPGDGDKKAADFAIGDKVPFRLATKVPDMSGFEADKDGQHGGRYVFEVCDTMSKGLTLNPDSIKIKIGEQDYHNFDLVKVGAPTEEGQKWRIVFGIDKNGSQSDDCKVDKDGCTNTNPSNDNDVLSDKDGVLNDEMFKANKGKPIVITYDATLNENAFLGEQGNENTANVLYSNNPYKPESVNHTWDSKTHAFTFGLDLTKINDEKQPLADAEFELKTKNGQTVIKVNKQSDGSYIIDKNGTDTLKSDDNGKIIVKGLDAGEYQLVETKAPDGYNLLDKPLDFTITPEYKQYEEGQYQDLVGELTDLKVTGKDSESFKADKTKGMVSTEVVNKAGGLLPKTGGRGIFMLAAIGLALMALATYVLFGRKKATK